MNDERIKNVANSKLRRRIIPCILRNVLYLIGSTVIKAYLYFGGPMQYLVVRRAVEHEVIVEVTVQDGQQQGSSCIDRIGMSVFATATYIIMCMFELKCNDSKAKYR